MTVRLVQFHQKWNASRKSYGDLRRHGKALCSADDGTWLRSKSQLVDLRRKSIAHSIIRC